MKIFSDTELGIIAGAARKVWNDIAFDILRSVADEQKKNINAVLIPRDHVVELVLDASRLEEELRHQRCGKDFLTRVEKDLYSSPSNIERHLTVNVFKFEQYGT